MSKREKFNELQKRLAAPVRTADVIVFDTETTGLDAKKNGIVDLGIVSGDGEVLFSERLNPKFGTLWSEKASEVNGIYPWTVAEELMIRDYLPILQEIFGRAKVIVGYNVPFDLRFVEAAGIKWNDNAEIVDVMKPYAYVVGEWNPRYGDYRFQKLTKCADQYKYEWVGTAHGALADALATLYCWPRVMRDYAKMKAMRGDTSLS